MAYDNTIPAPGTAISATQAGILANFVSLKAAFEATHVSFDAINTGKHFNVTLPTGASPVRTYVAGDIMLFSKLNGAIPDLYKREENVLGTPAPVETLVAGTDSIASFIQLSSGVRIKWGTAYAGAGSDTVLFGGPAFTQIPLVLVTPQFLPGSGYRPFSWGNVTLTSFHLNTDGTYFNNYWLAIGV